MAERGPNVSNATEQPAMIISQGNPVAASPRAWPAGLTMVSLPAIEISVRSVMTLIWTFNLAVRRSQGKQIFSISRIN
jgi:hypothetical protein